MLFDFLLAAQRCSGATRKSDFVLYLKLAKNTQDPRVAQRATEAALLQVRQPVRLFGSGVKSDRTRSGIDSSPSDDGCIAGAF